VPTTTAVRRYDERASAPADTETVTFGLGCFWGPAARFGALDGVVRTRVGYAGGTKPDPTYHALGDHTEVVQVDVDPDRLSVSGVFERVFREHDPSRQVSKRQYQNVVLPAGEAQATAVSSVLAELGLSGEAVATRVEPLGSFTLAEPYHQKHALKGRPPLFGVFEELGYDDAAVRESPAAAKLAGYATGADVTPARELGVPAR
jgi:peptide-methionine (S)-S-oxide reductase